MNKLPHSVLSKIIVDAIGVANEHLIVHRFSGNKPSVLYYEEDPEDPETWRILYMGADDCCDMKRREIEAEMIATAVLDQWDKR